MSTTTIPGRAHFTCFLVVAVVTVFLPITTVGAVPLHPGHVKSIYSIFHDAESIERMMRLLKVQHPIETSAPWISCHCNLHKCMKSSDGMPIVSPNCKTRLGCFSRVQTNFLNTSNYHQEGFYGCLDDLPTNLHSCSKMFNLTEDSEFPALPFVNSSNSVHAYHCCQHDWCNNRTNPAMNPIQDSVRVTKTTPNTMQLPNPNNTITETKTNWLEDNEKDFIHPVYVEMSERLIVRKAHTRNKRSISAEFEITTPNDTANNPINNKENVTLGEILQYMKLWNFTISDDLEMSAFANTEDIDIEETQTNKNENITMGEIIAFLKWFEPVISIDFGKIAEPETSQTPIRNKISTSSVNDFLPVNPNRENIAKLIDYFKTLNFSESNYFRKATLDDDITTPARNKRSTNMVDIHKFKNWSEGNALTLPGFVNDTARVSKIHKQSMDHILIYVISLFKVKTASTETVKTTVNNKKIHDTANVLKVKEWLESVVSDEKAVSPNTAKTMGSNKKISNISNVLKVMKWLDMAIMSSDFQKIASIDNANLPMNRENTSDVVDVPKVTKWFESVIPGDSEMIALADRTKTPTMTELSSNTQKNESIFVAPQEFPTTSSVYTPIYYMKPDFPAADFQKMVKIIKSMIPEVKGFPGSIIINHHLNEEKKARAGTNANVERTTVLNPPMEHANNTQSYWYTNSPNNHNHTQNRLHFHHFVH